MADDSYDMWPTESASVSTPAVGAAADDPLWVYAGLGNETITPGRAEPGATSAADADFKMDWKNPVSSFAKLLGFSGNTPADGAARAATIAAAGGLLAGAGQGYFAGKKREQEMEIAKQQIDVNKLTANSQAEINRQRMANQSGVFGFKPVGLINQPAKTTPV